MPLSSTELRIRQAEPSDAVEWARMREALWPEVTASEHAAEVDAWFRGERPNDEVWMAERGDGSLCGFLELSIRSHAEGCEPGNVPYVEGWWVEPQDRQLGVGGAMMATVEAWAAAKGYDELASDTHLGNSEGLAAHLALGFEEVERAIHFRKRVENSN